MMNLKFRLLEVNLLFDVSTILHQKMEKSCLLFLFEFNVVFFLK